jgi:exopolysaccharide production protein ExoZ
MGHLRPLLSIFAAEKAESKGHEGYIDAVRGWAILLVIMVHSSQTAPALDGWAEKIAVQGARGVQLFYIASALTLMMSWHNRKDGVLAFYLRRLFRIAPMFWLAIIFFLAVNGTGKSFWAPQGVHEWQIVTTALFVHGFHPQSINSVVPGGWSIAVEMTFYALFPLLARLITSWRVAAVWLAGSLCLALALYPYAAAWWPGEDRELAKNYGFLWFPNQLPCFLVGILLYYLQPVSLQVSRALLFISIVAMAIMALWTPPLPIHLPYTLAFGMFVFALANGAGKPLMARPLRFIGRISYSAYLWHFALLAGVAWLLRHGSDPFGLEDKTRGLGTFLIAFPCLTAVTVALSTLTHATIEVPMIRMGSRVVRWLHPKRLPAGQVATMTVGPAIAKISTGTPLPR